MNIWPGWVTETSLSSSRPTNRQAVRGSASMQAELSFLDYAARVAGLRKAMPGQVMIVSGGHNSIESGDHCHDLATRP